MILRRVIEHVKAQNWTAVALDFVIVVMGVFIGIQVANWNEARGLRAAEADYLRALKSDAVYSIGKLELMNENMKAQQSARRTLYDLARDPDLNALPEDIDGLLQAGIFSVQRINVSQVAFNALTSSGQLSLIDDAELTTALQELDAAIASARQGQDESILFTYEHTDPYLIDEADMEDIILTQGLVGDDGILGWPVGTDHPETFLSAIKSRRFKNLILYQSEMTRGRIIATTALLEQYKTVLALIEARQSEIGKN